MQAETHGSQPSHGWLKDEEHGQRSDDQVFDIETVVCKCGVP